MRSLCVLLFVALACSLTVKDLNAHHASTIRGFQQAIGQPRVSSGGFELQGEAECQAAIDAVQLIQCPVFTIFDETSTYTPEELNTLIGDHCSADATSCSSRLDAALVDVIAQCLPVLEAIPELWVSIGYFLVINRVPCLSDAEGDWCFTEFKMTLTRLSTMNTDPLDAADLEEACDECTFKVLFTWIAFEPTMEAIYATSTVDLLCSRAGGNWCWLEFQTAIAALEGAADDQLVNLAPLYCVPCSFIYLRKWKTLLEETNVDGSLDSELTDATAASKYMGWLCVTNRNGEYCNALLAAYDFDAVGDACEGVGTASPTGGPMCTSACHDGIAKVIGDLGCCLDTWLDLLTWSCTFGPDAGSDDCTNPNNSPAQIRLMIEFLCELKVPKGCGYSRSLTASLIVNNLKWGWCQANMPDCLLIIRGAIAQQFYLDVADLRESVLAANLSQVPQTPTRRLLQDPDNGVYVSVAGLTNSIGFTDTSNTAPVTLSGVNGAARADPTEPTTTELLSAEVKQQGGAALLVPSVSLALLGVFLLLV